LKSLNYINIQIDKDTLQKFFNAFHKAKSTVSQVKIKLFIVPIPHYSLELIGLIKYD